jgi:hypothetical protein
VFCRRNHVTEEKKRPDAVQRGHASDADDNEFGERKEKVLHTRIPDSLDRQIKRRARNLGMSVSTVVRNVLLHTFDLVEDIVTDSANLAISIAGEDPDPANERARHRKNAAPPTAATDGEILGWQEAILNRNAVCDRCNAILEKGNAAAIGICDPPRSRSIICPACFAAVSKGEAPGA